MAGLHNLAWTMLGDFNEILSSADKCGGNPINLRRAQIFKDCLNACNLIDLGFQGSKYTWVNKQDIGHSSKNAWTKLLQTRSGLIFIQRHQLLTSQGCIQIAAPFFLVLTRLLHLG